VTYQMTELINAKCDTGTLDSDALAWIVDAYTNDALPDYQMASFLMAVRLQGMTDEELTAWTAAMINSGELLDLSGTALAKVDKHSTGGVGDKISIPLVPLVACCGAAVPMISGRGLGHTGGTLDKLESIPGFQTDLTTWDFKQQLEEIGAVFAGQSEQLCPADRRIYALRDATGTVPSIPLIASSIMSKKLVEDLDALVLDVKVGSGAFMKGIDAARALGEKMVSIGASYDATVVAMLTNMDQPLGAEVGNANEIAESIAVLKGEGPPDVVELTMTLGVEMLVAGGVTDRAGARQRLEDALVSGAGLAKFAEIIEAQEGDPAVIEDPSLLPDAPDSTVVTSPAEGFVARCDALTIGQAAVRLGAGRATKEDAIDPGVGITIHAKVGDQITAGAPLATVRSREADRLAACLSVLEAAWEFAGDPVEPQPLVLGEVR
jgi:pyrimidine-nucleoside phosphorylase